MVPKTTAIIIGLTSVDVTLAPVGRHVDGSAVNVEVEVELCSVEMVTYP